MGLKFNSQDITSNITSILLRYYFDITSILLRHYFDITSILLGNQCFFIAMATWSSGPAYHRSHLGCEKEFHQGIAFHAYFKKFQNFVPWFVGDKWTPGNLPEPSWWFLGLYVLGLGIFCVTERSSKIVKSIVDSQMVYFHTANPNWGIFWKALHRMENVGIFYGHLE
jgi:hypothetical protein